MGILDRLLSLLQSPRCPVSTTVLCLRVFIALARGGPSCAAEIVKQGVTLRAVVDKFLLPSGSDAPFPACVILSIRLLRWLCLASRGAADALAAAGFLNLLKRHLVPNDGDSSATMEVRPGGRLMLL